MLTRNLGGVFVLLLIFAASALYVEEPISARVTNVNEGGRTLTVTPLENSEDLPESLKLSLEPQVEMRGIESLDQLENGDEIIFEGNPKSDKEWIVRRIETTKRNNVMRAAPKRPGLIETVTQQIRSHWTDLRANIPVDRALYQRYADERLRVIEERYKGFQEELPVQLKEKMKSRILQSREYLGFLMGTANPEVWREAKQDYESSIANAQSVQKEAAAQAVSEKQKYVWEIEDRLLEQRYDLEELNAAYQLSYTPHKKSQAAEDMSYGEKIKDLHKQLDFAESRLKSIHKSEDVDWESQRAEMENQLFSIREEYFDLVETIGPMKDPNSAITR